MAFRSSDYRQAKAMRFTAGLDRIPSWADTTTYKHHFLVAHSQRYAMINSSLFFPPSPPTPFASSLRYDYCHCFPLSLQYSTTLSLPLFPLLLDIPRIRNSLYRPHSAALDRSS